jgi:ribosomal protein L7/L12
MAKGTTEKIAEPEGATTITAVQEREWTDSVGTASVGIGIMVLGALFFYLVGLWLKGQPNVLEAVRIVLGLAIFAGAAILGLAILRGLEARKAPRVPFPCPYCDTENYFVEAPAVDFDCESCHRTVHFENSAPIPIRTIICQACRSEHRVAVNVHRYVCDRCNRPLQISSDPTKQIAVAGADETDAMLQTYNVLLFAVDRRHENELAFKLQDLMFVNMKEARRLMGKATTNAPLVVNSNVALRKAEAIQRELQALGATVNIHASTGVSPTSRAK